MARTWKDNPYEDRGTKNARGRKKALKKARKAQRKAERKQEEKMFPDRDVEDVSWRAV